MNNKIAFHCRSFTRNCQIDKTYSRDEVIYITSSNFKYFKVIKILYKSILLDIFSDFDFGLDVREEEQNDKSKIHCNQATEFKYLICIFLYNVGGVSRNTAGSWMELLVTKVNG